MPAMLYMIGAVMCFYVGDTLTRHAAYMLRVTPTLAIRLIVGLVLVAIAAFVRRPPFSPRNATLFFVIARSIAYAGAIYCFATSFNTAKEMTSVYVISFLWPFILSAFIALIACIPEDFIRDLNGVKPQAEPARTKTAALAISVIMFAGIVVYYWPRLASHPSFLWSPEGLLCLGTALAYALINAFDLLIPPAVGRFEKLVAALIVSLLATGFFWFAEVRGGLTLLGHSEPLSDLALPLLQAAGAGLFSMLGLVCLTEAMSQGDPEKVGPLDYLTIAVSAGFTILYNHVWPSRFEWIGIALILGGAALLILMAWWQRREPTA